MGLMAEDRLEIMEFTARCRHDVDTRGVGLRLSASAEYGPVENPFGTPRRHAELPARIGGIVANTDAPPIAVGPGGSYADEAMKMDARWLFARREHVVEPRWAGAIGGRGR